MRKRRAATNIVAAVVGVVVLAIGIALGAVILGHVQNAYVSGINASLPSEAQTAISNTFTTVWNMWPLLTLIILVGIAALIIGYLGVFRGGGE